MVIFVAATSLFLLFALYVWMDSRSFHDSRSLCELPPLHTLVNKPGPYSPRDLSNRYRKFIEKKENMEVLNKIQNAGKEYVI
ncbi:MAG: hypothetical protein FWC15_04030 [Fibromonadales bacterium]|nr:hypothetical protein [Fibromonadales bacterium]